MQTRMQSGIEAIVNIVVGYVINLAMNFFIFPLIGFKITLGQNLAIGVLYTGVSLIRSYGLRRVFNRLHVRAAP